MLSFRIFCLVSAILIILCSSNPVMAENAESISYYDVYADVNGAAVYFDNEYMGDIANGVLTVQVVSDRSRPYNRVTVKKDEYRTAVAAIPETGGELKHVSIFLTLTPLTAKTGTISVTTSPTRGELYIDGEEKGVTPQRITGVEPGTYKVEIVCPGYETWSGTAVVVADETCNLDVDLKKRRAFGTLSVNSDITGAEIYVDGWYYGTTPMTVGGISAGTHLIQIKKDGYRDFTRTVIIKDSSITPVACSLISTDEPEDLPGILSITSSPAEATVYIDSVNRGITPVTITDLSPEVHQVKLAFPGYQDYRGSFVLSSGETRTLDAELQPIPAPEFAPVSLFAALMSLPAATMAAAGRHRRRKK